MSLDCHTNRGRTFIHAQHETTNILKKLYPSLDFIHSKKDQYAKRVDEKINKRINKN